LLYPKSGAGEDAGVFIAFPMTRTVLDLLRKMTLHDLLGT
jgi:hypothetical protein